MDSPKTTIYIMVKMLKVTQTVSPTFIPRETNLGSRVQPNLSLPKPLPPAPTHCSTNSSPKLRQTTTTEYRAGTTTNKKIQRQNHFATRSKIQPTVPELNANRLKTVTHSKNILNTADPWPSPPTPATSDWSSTTLFQATARPWSTNHVQRVQRQGSSRPTELIFQAPTSSHQYSTLTSSQNTQSVCINPAPRNSNLAEA